MGDVEGLTMCSRYSERGDGLKEYITLHSLPFEIRENIV